MAGEIWGRVACLPFACARMSSLRSPLLGSCVGEMLFIPTCPPDGCFSGLIDFLCTSGFRGTSAQLWSLHAWLPLHDVVAPADFAGLGNVRRLEGAAAFPEPVLVFLQSLVAVRSVAVVPCKLSLAFAWVCLPGGRGES